MRRVVQSEWVRAQVARTTDRYPTFLRIFESGVIWQLERNELQGVPIEGTNPRVFAIETNAWKAEGIPGMRIAYVETLDGIELRALLLRE